MAPPSKRLDGPCSATIAARELSAPRTGAATALSPTSRSSTASAKPGVAHPLDLAGERRGIGDRARGVSRQRHLRERDVAEGEEHLPRRRRVPHARTPEPRDALQVAVGGHEVDGDGISVARDGECCRLTDLGHELLEVRAGDVAEVEPSQHRVGEPEHAHAEPVAAGRRYVLDEPQPGERPELTGDGAGADPRAAGQIGRAHLASVGQGVEDGDGANRGLDVAGGRLTGTGHGDRSIATDSMQFRSSAIKCRCSSPAPTAGRARSRSCGAPARRRGARQGTPTVRELNEYVYFRENVAGVHREWWFCRACEDWFLAERDTVTNEVARTWHPGARVVSRLPPQPGERIDRSTEIYLHFKGKRVSAFAGDTIGSALYAAGQRIFSRSFKYHRPRGLQCCSGHCANCQMTVDGIPNVRVCTTPPREGAVVKRPELHRARSSAT